MSACSPTAPSFVAIWSAVWTGAGSTASEACNDRVCPPRLRMRRQMVAPFAVRRPTSSSSAPSRTAEVSSDLPSVPVSQSA